MRYDDIDAEHVCVFVMQVKQVDRAPIETALLNQHYVKTVGLLLARNPTCFPRT
jgi:hypothetical protein